MAGQQDPQGKGTRPNPRWRYCRPGSGFLVLSAGLSRCRWLGSTAPMASSGSGLQARVAYLLSGRHGKPRLNPTRELALADRVANRKGRLGEATCLTEMSLMMACWKEHAFSDSACAKEIQTFFSCAASAKAERKAGKNMESQSGRLPPNQVNQILRRFPNIKHEV